MRSKLSFLRSEINRAKVQLSEHAREQGIHENFGQDHVRRLTNKYEDCSDYTAEGKPIRLLINAFDEWAQNFTI